MTERSRSSVGRPGSSGLIPVSAAGERFLPAEAAGVQPTVHNGLWGIVVVALEDAFRAGGEEELDLGRLGEDVPARIRDGGSHQVPLSRYRCALDIEYLPVLDT
ncbi:hypothetical protein ACQPXB_43570 [Amycolatopsis sp. CA-161197]|uniref:hypothetical protein n=1 Tax=Amycolatopsis sp. CA-161197 TaxID=3239922 RepID=UPI003D8C9EF5